jgi:hypothetical protein
MKINILGIEIVYNLTQSLMSKRKTGLQKEFLIRHC